jgi:hypothetical protein
MMCGICPPLDTTTRDAQACHPGGYLMRTMNTSSSSTDHALPVRRTGSPECVDARQQVVGSSTLQHAGRRRRTRNTGVAIPTTNRGGSENLISAGDVNDRESFRREFFGQNNAPMSRALRLKRPEQTQPRAIVKERVAAWEEQKLIIPETAKIGSGPGRKT